MLNLDWRLVLVQFCPKLFVFFTIFYFIFMANFKHIYINCGVILNGESQSFYNRVENAIEEIVRTEYGRKR